MAGSAASAPIARRCLCAREAGTSHLETGLECQDAVGALEAQGRVFLALADGAGSARRASVGSSLAVASALEAARELWPTHGDPADDSAWRERLLGVLRAARNSLEERAAEPDPSDGIEDEAADRLRQLATTFLFAAVDGQRVGMIHVGDGWGVIEEADGRFSVLSAPDRSEYFNETVFLTGERYEEDARISLRDLDGAGGAVLTSDGLEMVLIDLARAEPHQPAFTGLLAFARDAATSVEDKAKRLSAFLRSERVCKKTDDDKSLVIAVFERPEKQAADVEPESA